MKEYKIAKGWAIFLFVFGIPAIALFACLLLVPSVFDMSFSGAYWIMAPISAIMIVVFVAALRDVVTGKFVIDHESVWETSTFSNRKLLFTEIKGYRTQDKYLFIEPIDAGKKRIKISNYLANTDEIVLWLASNYPDLDVLQAEEEKKEILNSEDYGFSTEERESKLATAHKAARALNIAGSIAGTWAFLYPQPYKAAIYVCMAVPLVCLAVLKYFGGLIRVDARKDSAYPSLFIAIIVSGMGLCVRALIDYTIFDHSRLLLPAGIMTLVYLGVMLVRNKEFSNAKAIPAAISMAFFVFGYSYGTVVALNCMLDSSLPEVFESRILSKRISSGKHTSYYLELTPWGHQKEVEEVDVSKYRYDRLAKGDTVSVYFMKGKLGAAWFEVGD